MTLLISALIRKSHTRRRETVLVSQTATGISQQNQMNQPEESIGLRKTGLAVSCRWTEKLTEVVPL